MEGSIAHSAKPEQSQPLRRQLMLTIGNRLINAYRIKETGQDHVTHAGADTVVQMQAAADVADMAFDIPDGFPAAASAAKQRQIVAVALRMIAGDQAEQGGFPAPFGPTICQCSPGLTCQLSWLRMGRSL